MADSKPTYAAIRKRLSFALIISYAFDWIVLIAVGVIAVVLGRIEPNKRPFSLYDPDISFPFTENETVPSWLLIVLVAAVPIVCIAVVSLIFVPGPTVPKGTSKALIWQRKLWELHVGWLGLALALVSAYFFTNGMKNMFGKPRPDLLSRCNPDIENAVKYVVGGFAGEGVTAQLYSAKICRQTDDYKLDDGFRSYPSGHSSSAAAGLIYLSLFLATKFAVNIPFVVPGRESSRTFAAFPSRLGSGHTSETQESARLHHGYDRSGASSPVGDKQPGLGSSSRYSDDHSFRRQAAAPPLYLLTIILVPFGLSIFIAASRWYNFRHHGFDILFGYLMGLATAYFSFRYYHLPIRAGAGWAWGPRSEPRAFWAGVGRLGYAGDRDPRAEPAMAVRRPRAETADADVHPYPSVADTLTQRNGQAAGPFTDVEMQSMGTRRV